MERRSQFAVIGAAVFLIGVVAIVSLMGGGLPERGGVLNSHVGDQQRTGAPNDLAVAAGRATDAASTHGQRPPIQGHRIAVIVALAGRSDLDGPIALTLASASSVGVRVEASSSNGEFSRDDIPPGTYRVEGVHTLDEDYPFPLPDLDIREHAAVHVQLLPKHAAVLRIIDSETGMPVPNSIVWVPRGTAMPAGADPFGDTGPLPPREVTELECVPVDDDGLARLSMRWASTPTRIGAPGYAWQALVVPHVGGAPVDVELVRGGGLDIRTPASGDDKAVQIELYSRGQGPPIAMEAAPSGLTEIRGLHPGDWRIQATQGSTAWSWSGVATVVAGRTAVIDSRESVDVTTDRGTVDLTIHVPSSWGESTLSITIRRADEGRAVIALRTVQVDPATGDATMQLLAAPGAMIVEIPRLGWADPIEFRADRGARRSVVVPEPMDLQVRVLANDDGSNVDGAQVQWWQDRAGKFGPTGGATRTGPDGRTTLRVPAANGVVSVGAAGFADAWEAVPASTVQQGMVVNVSLRRGGSVDIVAWAGDRPLPSIEAVLERVGGGGVIRLSTPERGHLRATELTPGRWRITVADVPGFLPVPEREVEITDRQTTEVSVQLTRRPERAR